MTPEQRYSALVRPMAEWFALSPTSSSRWLALSREAMSFVED